MGGPNAASGDRQRVAAMLATCSYVKLRAQLTIGIEGKARLPYVETFWAKTGKFLNVQRGQIL
jgi:hypothetical protein